MGEMKLSLLGGDSCTISDASRQLFQLDLDSRSGSTDAVNGQHSPRGHLVYPDAHIRQNGQWNTGKEFVRGNRGVHIKEKQHKPTNTDSLEINCHSHDLSSTFDARAVPERASDNFVGADGGSKHMVMSADERNCDSMDDLSSSVLEGSSTSPEPQLSAGFPCARGGPLMAVTMSDHCIATGESEALSKSSYVLDSMNTETFELFSTIMESRTGSLLVKNIPGMSTHMNAHPQDGHNYTGTSFLLIKNSKSLISTIKQSPHYSAKFSHRSGLNEFLTEDDLVLQHDTPSISSLRLTQRTKSASQVSEMLDAIPKLLTHLRRKRSCLHVRARSSLWGRLDSALEAFAQNGQPLKYDGFRLKKVLGNTLKKRKGGMHGRGGGRSLKMQQKLNSQIHCQKEGNLNGIHAMVNLGEDTTAPDLTISSDTGLECPGELDASDEDPKFEPESKIHSSDGNQEKPLPGGTLREKDIESTITQDTSASNTSDDYDVTFSQTEAETSGEAPEGRVIDSGASPYSDVPGSVRRPVGIERNDASSTSGETLYTLGCATASSKLNYVESSGVDAHEMALRHDARDNTIFAGGNDREAGYVCDEDLHDMKVVSSSNVLSPKVVPPLNTQQHFRRKCQTRKEIKENVGSKCFVESVPGSIIRNKGRKDAFTSDSQRIGGTGCRNGQISGSSVIGMDPSSKGAFQEVPTMEISLENSGFVAQDIEHKRCSLPKKSRTGKRGRLRRHDLVASTRRSSCEQKKEMLQQSACRSMINCAGLSYCGGLEEGSSACLGIASSLNKNWNLVATEEVDSTDILSYSKLNMDKWQECEPKPRAAWVRCDECFKWRRISVELADEIEATNCKWICKENLDKQFADCSAPQEKSNAEINAELDISDASGEEEMRGPGSKSAQLEPRPITVPVEAQWTLIKHNIFLHRSCKTQTIDEIMVCHCKPPSDGNLGCGEECLNRMLNIECVKGTCPCGDLCSNQKFQQRKYAKFKCFRCGKKGYGLQLLEDASQGEFLIEYVGEVLDLHTFETRQREYASRGQKHFYFMTLNSSEVIDACAKGNLGRFINHSCDPNCRTEKWMVNGEVCIGLFALRDIKKGEEVTFDYNYVRVFGAAVKKCVCGSSVCRGYIGGDPTSTEEIVQVNSDDEYPEPVMVNEDDVIDLNEVVNRLDSPNAVDNMVPTSVPVKRLQISPEMKEDDLTDDSLLFNNKRLACKEAITWGPAPESSSFVTASYTGKTSNFSLEEGNSLQIDGMVNKLFLAEEQLEVCSSSACRSPEVEKGFLQTESKGTSASVFLQNHEYPGNEQARPSSQSKEILAKSLSGSGLLGSVLSQNKSKGLPLSTESCGKLIRGIVPNEAKHAAVSCQLKLSRASSSVMKAKSSTSHVVDHKTKKLEGTGNRRCDGVVEKLNELLDPEGGISKGKDAARSYLKLLFLTFASGDHVRGEASQSTRELSIFLDALLKTKSRSILTDILNKNGLQVLHNILKQNRGNFNKIPIIRKLLKVLEFLAIREILTFEHINEDPPCPGMESLRESIISLTRHKDIEVHHIARDFRDRWIPHAVDKGYSHRDSLKLDSCIDAHGHKDYCKRGHDNDATMPVPVSLCTNPDMILPISPHGTRSVRRRKSRWDQPEVTCAMKSCDSCSTTFEPVPPHTVGINLKPGLACNDSVIEDGPPGFAPAASGVRFPNAVMGQVQPRYLSRLPVSYGIPWALVQEFGIPCAERSDLWDVAPGIPFHPFPPLPPYPRDGSGSKGIQSLAPGVAKEHSRGYGSVREPTSGCCERKYSRGSNRAPRFEIPWARRMYNSYNSSHQYNKSHHHRNHRDHIRNNSVLHTENTSDELGSRPSSYKNLNAKQSGSCWNNDRTNYCQHSHAHFEHKCK